MLLHPDIAVAMCACYRSQWLRCCWLSVLSVPDYDLTGALHFAVTLFVIFAEKYFTLGDYPVRVSGMKVYQTSDESCILETPVCWGSNAAVRAVVVQAPGGGGGGAGLAVPVWHGLMSRGSKAAVSAGSLQAVGCRLSCA
jgi:hypothetical protein